MLESDQKLCIVTNRYPAHPDDTASPFVRDFHLELVKRGVQVTLFTPAYDSQYLDTPEGVHRFQWAGGNTTVGELSLSSPAGLYKLFSFLKQAKKGLFELIRKESPNHCLALWALPSGWFAYQVKEAFGIPYSVWCLGSDIYVWARKPLFKQLTRMVLKEADYLFADGFDLSERVRQLTGKRCHFLPSQRILPKSDTITASPLDQKFHNFLYLGRWEKAKGILDLIQAFRIVAGQNPKARLYLMGWGSSEKELRELVDRLSLNNFVKMVGKVDIPTLSSYLKNCDWVVIPSQGDSIPLVLSEALQFRKPVVVTDVGDLGTLTQKYNLGKVVPVNDPEKLAGAMLEVSRERTDYTRQMPEVLKFLSVEKGVDDFLKTLSWTTRPRRSRVKRQIRATV